MNKDFSILADPQSWVVFLFVLGMAFAPELVARGHKQYRDTELAAVSEI